MQTPLRSEFNTTLHPQSLMMELKNMVWNISQTVRSLKGNLNISWWKGYGIEEDEWRLSEDVKGMRRLMSEFHRQNPKAPQHISAIDFSRLPFGPLTNFMDTLDTGPSD